MRAQTTACLFGAILCIPLGACRGTSDADSGAPQDLATGPGGNDAAMVSTMETTIRDLNTPGKVPDGTPVKLTGVVTSPMTWIDTPGSCTYEAFIGQPDQAPTLKDGIALYYSKSMAVADGGSLTVTQCKNALKDSDILKLTTGHTVEVTGKFEIGKGIRLGVRQVFLTTGNGAVDKGEAATKPTPVTVQVADLDDQTKLLAAAGALVQIKAVTVTEQILGTGMTPTVFGFKVSDASSNTATVSVDISYLKVLDKTYMASAKGDMLPAVTGVVHGDSKAEYTRIWPRSKAEAGQ